MKSALVALALMVLLALQGCSKSDVPVTGSTTSDSELRERVTGLWFGKDDRDGTVTSMYMDLTASDDVKLTGSSKEGDFVYRGTWKVDKGHLVVDIPAAPGTVDKPIHMDYPINVVSKSSLTLVDTDQNNAPETFERATQIPEGFGKTVGQAKGESQPQAQQAPARTAVAAPTTSAATTDVEPDVHLLYQQSHYVVEKERVVIPLHITRDENVKVSVKIDQPVPIDLIVLPWKETAAGYEKIIEGLAINEAQKENWALFGKDSLLGKPEKGAMTTAHLFLWPGSKKGAYGEYTSEWSPYPADEYTIILDNSGEITPTRGDAPVQIAVWAQDVKK